MPSYVAVVLVARSWYWLSRPILLWSQACFSQTGIPTTGFQRQFLHVCLVAIRIDSEAFRLLKVKR